MKCQLLILITLDKFIKTEAQHSVLFEIKTMIFQKCNQNTSLAGKPQTMKKIQLSEKTFIKNQR